MSARIGMDASVVRQAASAIDSHAGDLDRVIGSVDGLVSEITGNWFGASATEFHESWAHRHRGALTALTTALHAYARVARTNADAQDRTSAVSEGSAGAASAGGQAGWSSWLAPVGLIGPQLLKRMADTPRDVGRYPKTWEKFLKRAPSSWNNVLKHAPAGFQRKFADLPNEVLRYKRWGVVHDLNDLHGFVAGADKLTGVLTVGADGYAVTQDLHNHDLVNAGFDGATTAADVLKSTKVGYLGGVAVQSWVQAGRAAQNVDWSSQGMSEVLHASPREWASAFGGAVSQMPSQLLKIF